MLNQLSLRAPEHKYSVPTPCLFSDKTPVIVEHDCLPSFSARSGSTAQDFACVALEEFEEEVKNQWRTPVMYNESLYPGAGSTQPALDIIEPAPSLVQPTTLANEAGVAIPSDTRTNAFSPPNKDNEFVSVNLDTHDMPAVQGINVEAEAIDGFIAIAREGEYTSSEQPNTQDDEFAIVGGTLTSPAEHDCLPSFPAGSGSTVNRLIYPRQDFAYAALEEFEKEVKNQWRTPVIYNESLHPSAGSAHPALDIIEPAPSLVQPAALANEAGVAIPSDTPTKAFSPPNQDTEFVSVNLNTRDMPAVQGVNVKAEAIDGIAREGEYTSSEQPNTQDDEFAIVGGTLTSPAEHDCLPSFPAGWGSTANRLIYPCQDFAYAASEEFEKEVKNQWRTPVVYNESLDPSAGSAQPALDITETAPSFVQPTTLANEAGVAIPSDTPTKAFSPPNKDTEFVSVNINTHGMPAVQGINVEVEVIDDFIVIAREGEYTSSEQPNTQDDEFDWFEIDA